MSQAPVQRCPHVLPQDLGSTKLAEAALPSRVALASGAARHGACCGAATMARLHP